jgi:hypothetical protein
MHASTICVFDSADSTFLWSPMRYCLRFEITFIRDERRPGMRSPAGRLMLRSIWINTSQLASSMVRSERWLQEWSAIAGRRRSTLQVT